MSSALRRCVRLSIQPAQYSDGGLSLPPGSRQFDSAVLSGEN